MIHLRRCLHSIHEDAENDLAPAVRTLFQRLGEHIKLLDHQVQELERQILVWHRQNPACQKLQVVPGIGPLTATAMVASVGDAKSFQNEWQLAAWLGLVPRQRSSGGKSLLLGISKRDDLYLRTLLIHGTRTAIRLLGGCQDNLAQWTHNILDRRNKNVDTVTLANRNSRIAWALLTQDKPFLFNYPATAGAVVV